MAIPCAGNPSLPCPRASIAIAGNHFTCLPLHIVSRHILPRQNTTLSLFKSRNSRAPCLRRSQPPAKRRSTRVAPLRGEDLLALRDQVVGSSRRQGLNRQAMIGRTLRGQNASVAHEQIRNIVRASELIHHRRSRVRTPPAGAHQVGIPGFLHHLDRPAARITSITSSLPALISFLSLSCRLKLACGIANPNWSFSSASVTRLSATAGSSALHIEVLLWPKHPMRIEGGISDPQLLAGPQGVVLICTENPAVIPKGDTDKWDLSCQHSDGFKGASGTGARSNPAAHFCGVILTRCP